MLPKLAVLAMLFVFAQPGASMAKARVIKRKPVYGHGVNQLPSANTLPTAYNLAVQAVGDADGWWAQQGRTLPPLELTAAAPPDGEHVGFGYYNTGRVQIAPSYLASLNQRLPTYNRHGQIEALVGLWALMAHERGPNLGYGHIPGGIMDADWTSPPGEAYEWAARTLPRKRIRRKRH